MIKTTLKFNNNDFSDEQLNESISEMLANHTTFAMATIKENTSYINTAHYAFDENLKLVIFTQPYTQHSKNIEQNRSVAVAIWNEPEERGTNLQGLQLFGTCERVTDQELQEAIDIQIESNPGFANLVKKPEDFATATTESRLYWIKIESIKLIDEPRFGKRNFILLNIRK